MFKFCGSEIKGAIFDLDGTLIDSMEIWREVDEEFFARRGMAVPETYQQDIAHLGPADKLLFGGGEDRPRVAEAGEQMHGAFDPDAGCHCQGDIFEDHVSEAA